MFLPGLRGVRCGVIKAVNIKHVRLNQNRREEMRRNSLSVVFKIVGVLVCLIFMSPITAEAKSLILRLAHSEPTANIRHEASLYFADRVKELSGGGIEVEVYPAGQMGTHTQCQEMVASGSLDVYPTTAGMVSVFDPNRAQELIELPYLFDNYAQAYAFMDTDYVTRMYDSLKSKGIHYLATWCNGFRQMTNNKRPIYTPADMKGLKIRVVKSEMSMKIISSLGASAVPMAYSELYTALGSGVVDGQENPFMNIYDAKFYEVQKFLSVTKHQYSTLPVIFSEKRWQSLDESQQAILKQACLESATFMRKKIGANEGNQRAAMEKEGMKINDVDDLTPFREAVKPVYQWAKEKWGGDKVEDLLKKIDDIRQKYPEEGSYIGLEIE
jgi:tripartite ATP-independent transporter DctP family solute receptor